MFKLFILALAMLVGCATSPQSSRPSDKITCQGPWETVPAFSPDAKLKVTAESQLVDTLGDPLRPLLSSGLRWDNPNHATVLVEAAVVRDQPAFHGSVTEELGATWFETIHVCGVGTEWSLTCANVGHIDTIEVCSVRTSMMVGGTRRWVTFDDLGIGVRRWTSIYNSGSYLGVRVTVGSDHSNWFVVLPAGYLVLNRP
jgi:hypothetical protein